tara:strand:+ start:2601 stop:2816 length:216 start_codon:yes stop_codon:yes gene_type:complete
VNQQEIRVLVHETIDRDFSSSGDVSALSSSGDTDASHVLFALPNGTDVGGSCIIEPAVFCNHCGYCKSYGH